MIKSNLARSCALDADYAQSVTNLVASGNAPEFAWRLIRECFRWREDRNRELLRKPRRSAVVIRARHNDSRNAGGTDKLVQRFALQRNWIDKAGTVGSQEACRIKFGFNGWIITVPKGEIRSDSVEIGCWPHGPIMSADHIAYKSGIFWGAQAASL